MLQQASRPCVVVLGHHLPVGLLHVGCVCSPVLLVAVPRQKGKRSDTPSLEGGCGRNRDSPALTLPHGCRRVFQLSPVRQHVHYFNTIVLRNLRSFR